VSQVLDRGAQADARSTARCAFNVHGRDARADACGRDARADACGRGCGFVVLSTQFSTVCLRLRIVVPRPMPVAVASRCCRRRFQQLACACGTIG
jgi:hypothetical protein